MADCETYCHDEVRYHSRVVREQEIEEPSNDGYFVEIVTEQGESPRKREEGHRCCLIDE